MVIQEPNAGRDLKILGPGVPERVVHGDQVRDRILGGKGLEQLAAYEPGGAGYGRLLRILTGG